MRIVCRVWKSLSVAFWPLALIVTAAAQSDRGTIAGSVVDSTGAAIQNASISIRSVDTGTVYEAKSTGDGVYRISDVRIGRYDVTVKAGGFKNSTRTGVQIQINTTTALNITMEPGSVTEEVTVSADAPTLQTESSEVGTVVGDRQIHDLPLALNSTGQSFVRSPETFIFLTPGTVGQGTVGDHGSAGIFETKLSGGQNFGSEILLDGASVQRSDSGTAFDQTAPSVEALTEFKVTTATPTAQYGHTSGGVESFTTKSGSNGFHGSVFELFRNEALDANSWTNNFFQVEKPRDRQNDFGGSIGGPVWIPKLYDGRNKTFFFFSWEQYRNRRGLSNSVQTLPTDAERAGDFSALLGAPLVDPDTSAPVINPCTGDQVLQGQIFDPSTTQVVGGRTCRLPFPNNQIANLSPVAQNVLGYVPTTNRPGVAANGVSGLSQNFLNSAVLDHVVTTQTSFRIDENLTQKHKLFFTYHSREQNFLNANDFPLPAPITPDNYYNYYFTHYFRVGWDFLATPSLLNHLTVGFNRVYTASKSPAVDGTDWPQVLGISNASGQTFPTFEFNGGQYSIGYSKFGGSAYTLQIPNALVVADNVSWTHGRHALQLGFDWRSYQFSVLKPGASSPHYFFEGRETSFTPETEDPNATNAGDPMASFLLGLPDRETLTVFSHYPRLAQNYYAAYVQDDFKFRRNLTLNLGLRWDIETPRHESTGAQSVLSLTASNPATPGQLGALIYGRSATGTGTYFKNIGPRIGFAWSPRDKLVVRGGYSIYYAPLTYSDFGDNLTSGTTADPNFQNLDNFTPVQSLDAGFPSYTPPSNSQDPALNTFTNNTVTYVASEYGRPGMVQNWQLEVQHELAPDLIFDIGYVGQHGTRLRSNLAQVNTPDPKYNYLGNALQYLVDGSDGNSGPAILSQLGITVPSWFVPGWGGSATIGQLLRPFPQYGFITTNCCLENLGQSTYHALQTKLERRFRNGLNLLASYTFSKTITDADSSFSTLTGFNSNVFGAQNPYNLRAEKAVSYQDIPHAFVLSYLYELPFGHGKKYLNHGVASKIAGGWQISGIHRYQAGSPAIINAYATTNPYSGGNFRFSLIPGQQLFPTNPVQWTPALDSVWDSGCFTQNGVFTPNNPGSPRPANCSAFVDPSAAALAAGGGYVFGDLPVAVSWWRSPGYMNEDFAIIKRTNITESQNILFKLDIPNAFNRHTFGGIDGYPGDKYFGVPGGSGHSVINGPRQLQISLRYEF